MRANLFHRWVLRGICWLRFGELRALGRRRVSLVFMFCVVRVQITSLTLIAFLIVWPRRFGRCQSSVLLHACFRYDDGCDRSSGSTAQSGAVVYVFSICIYCSLPAVVVSLLNLCFMMCCGITFVFAASSALDLGISELQALCARISFVARFRASSVVCDVAG